ncbi:MAG: tRNA (adenosine(37)-N6)-threonylcarbamoyltransferase complex ATPase subunit type 1 TsaE [Chloracidobacterium sp.]|nr:tRNA (adenosine(37)-N6)-threonylcarbamoyltransferase complex ATPase subunit type 1 TsaE [Chloracidobacterium sp.]
MTGEYPSTSPDETFGLGEKLGNSLTSGDIVLLYGGLGTGKTLLTKGILHGLDDDVDEVTSPSFALVNLYRTPRFDVFHIDLWRLDASDDPASDVGLEEILANDDAVTIIEWADRLKAVPEGHRIITIEITGDGDSLREIVIRQ